MNTDSRRAFRDYATRVSFNLSLTRNQIAVMRTIKLQQGLTFNETMRRWPGDRLYTSISKEIGRPDTDMFLPGVKPLLTMGLCRLVPTSDDPKTPGYRTGNERGTGWFLTEAGERVYELLVMASLAPPMETANDNFADWKTSRLRREAKRLGMPGHVSRMGRDELIINLREAIA